MTADEIRQTIRSFILENYLRGAPPSDLADDASLERSHIVDSARVLDLILHIEEVFGFEVQNEDAVPDNFDTVDNIVAYISRKLG
jgi:acyl carrier protein